MIRRLTYLGEPVLRQKCDVVTAVTEEIRALADDMLETMIDANGVGIAAPQVGVPIRMAIVDVQLDDEQRGLFQVDGKEVDYAAWMPLIFINPELQLGKEKERGSEGCLSIPDVLAEVERSYAISAKLTMLDGKEIEVKADGLLARVLQHEIDHLNGILFIDRLSAAAKLRVRRAIKKARKDW